MKKKMVSAIIMAIMLSLTACGEENFAPEEEIKPAVTEETVQDETVQDETEIESIETERAEIEEVVDLDKEVVFTDEYLAEEAKKQASSLTVGGLQEITDLDLNYDKITVPKELAYFTNLQSLEMSATNSGDVSWHSYFPDLKYLYLKYTTLQLLKKSNAQGTFRSIISLQTNPYERE